VRTEKFVARSLDSEISAPTQRIADSSASNPQRRIGVFDSGVGGLTVLHALRQRLPQESFLYFGDTAHLPYGTRSQAEIIHYVRQILTWMAQEQVKMAIMACNTSSALALEAVRTEFDFPILGLILPAARAAVKYGKRVGIIATPATVNSECYPKAMTEINPQIQVHQVACPDFVTLVEQGRIHDSETLRVARGYLKPLLAAKIDTLVYGCTHFPHLQPVINQILPSAVRQVNPAHYVATAVAQELEMLGLQHRGRVILPNRFGVSGCPGQFAQVAGQLMSKHYPIEKVDLSRLTISAA
jgi:glutamate racemase